MTRWIVDESASDSIRIDKAAGIIYDVLVVGMRKKGPRKYTEVAFEDAVKRRIYENLQVYIGPHKRSRFAKRSPNEHAGELQNVRRCSKGIMADLKYNRESSGGKLALEIAERFPKAFGLSHHGEVEGYEDDDGNKIVSRILEVNVADIVKDPATTESVFEEVDVEELTVEDAVARMRETILGISGVGDEIKAKAAKLLDGIRSTLDGKEAAEEATVPKKKKRGAMLRQIVAEAVAAAMPKAPPASTPAPAPAKKPPKSTARKEEAAESVPTPMKPSFKREKVLEAYEVEE